MKNKVNSQPNRLSVRREKGKIWSHIRKKWLVETPEETVRQEYLCTLVNEYGFQLDQMTEEDDVTGRGSGRARADFVIWRTAKDKSDSKNPLIVVECKSDLLICTDARNRLIAQNADQGAKGTGQTSSPESASP